MLHEMEPLERPDPSVHRARRGARTKTSVRKATAPIKPNKMNMKWKNNHDYTLLNTVSIVHCRIPHPNPFMGRDGKGIEFHLREVPWSGSQYVDIRKCHTKTGYYGKGILLHYDVMKAMLPYLLGLMQELEARETREPEHIRKVEVFDGSERTDCVPPVLGD